MNLSEIANSLKEHFETEEAKARNFLDEHLPGLADLADKAAASPLVDAVLSAAHLSPEMLSGLADMIRKLDSELGAAKAAQSAAEAALHPAEPEPEPSAA